MTNIKSGLDALNSLQQDNTETNTSMEFTRIKSGESVIVKVPGLCVISAFVYNSFNKNINSFIAENPSDKSDRGFPTKNLTPFDKAWKHFKDQSDDWQDEMAGEAYEYLAKERFTFGFFDLATGGKIAVEFTKNQARVIVDSVKKYEKRLGQFAFELSKQGKGRDTTVSLSIIPMLEDLTEAQQKQFAELPEELATTVLNDIHYKMSDDEQLETLIRVGFDVKLIGLEAPKQGEDAAQGGTADNPVDNTQVASVDDLPF